MFDRLRELLGGKSDSSGTDEEQRYRCVNCGQEFSRPQQECPDCGGPYVAPIDGDGRNT